MDCLGEATERGRGARLVRPSRFVGFIEFPRWWWHEPVGIERDRGGRPLTSRRSDHIAACLHAGAEVYEVHHSIALVVQSARDDHAYVGEPQERHSVTILVEHDVHDIAN